MIEQNHPKNQEQISNNLFFTSLINSSFDYSIPLKLSLNRFCKEPRGEASKNLFEYLCYKIVEKQINQKGINELTAIISEKFLTSKDCITNLSKFDSSKKKYILIPICNSITHKWNAIIFVHLERQILQYLNKTNTEPIVAKIISSNINSEEDDYLLNTTMDKIENAFNFTSPEDIQFEVDSINICDQPNTSVFLINFIEGLVSQENNDESIMNYIMKLYDESSNTNAIGTNNYFVSFNKENEIFKDLIQNYFSEIKIYAKNNGVDIDNKNSDVNILDLINFKKEEEEDIESEEEALKLVAKDNEVVLKKMEEQELFFSNNTNGPFNLNLEEMNNMPPKTILGLIQEVENESDEDTEHRNDANNNNSLIKKDDININSDEEEGNENSSKANIELKENIKNKDKIENTNNNIDEANKDINEKNNRNENDEKNIKENETKEDINLINDKINNSKNNKQMHRNNIQSENIVNKNMTKLSNNLEKMKNEILNNLSKEKNTLRGSYGIRNDTLEKLKLLTETNNESILSKSFNEKKNINSNTYNVINLQRNQKYNNSTFYISKSTNKEKNNNVNNNININKEENILISNNTNYYEDKSNIINNKTNEIKNSNKIIYESNSNKTGNKNNKKIKENDDNKKAKNNGGKNTIIINETSNNNTVINFIEIKNNYEPDNIKNNSDIENDIPEDGKTNKLLETFSPYKTLSGMNKENVDNLIDIKKKNTYRGKSMVNFDFLPERGLKDDKLALLNDYLYGNDFLSPKNNKEKIHNSHNSFNELNHYNIDNDNEHNNNNNIKEEKKEEIYTQKNIIGMNTPKRTIKKMKYKSGPDKIRNYNNENNLDLLQEFRTNNNCTLNMSNDLNCGCAGIDNKCFIF